MTVQELIDNKLKHIKLNYSIGTFNHYVSHFTHFLNWCNKNDIVKVNELNDSKLIDYVTEMKSTCKNITINKRIGMLKRAFREAGINNEYLNSIKKFKEKTTTFEMIDLHTLKAIRKHVLTLPDISNNLTIKCSILLLMDTGCRVNELIKIERKNVSIEQLEILLTTTKTKEDRIVYFQQSTAQEIKKMLAIKTNSKYLLHHVGLDRPINYFDIDWMMKRYRKIFNMDKLHAHMFRHSLASILLENGADIKSVQEILGHSNLETTQRYLHTRKEHVKKTFFSKYNLDNK
ncbi:integrase/recombinase XerC/integrase/recombinase XerD [Acholeplasma morum]|uniref:tyrosine-type recombinase/integrase n=1 Tax=Paracholeplasma morum TaxID=264637 RepID=UPI0019564E70|nr:tyrosine-type recombinase/integrase [Paracholeplasma morum]MBM7454144.1 integrase/recombinase XerC/integrase/recombinase XerD [Paracholeplasma morum]